MKFIVKIINFWLNLELLRWKKIKKKKTWLLLQKQVKHDGSTLFGLINYIQAYRYYRATRRG